MFADGAGRCRQTRSMTQPQQSAAILPASAQQPDDSSSGRSAPPQAILRAPKRRHVSSSAPESKSCQTQRSAAMPPTPAQQPEDNFLPAQDVPWAPKRRHGSWVAQQGDHTQPQDSAGTLLTAVQQLGAAESGQKRIKTSRDAAEVPFTLTAILSRLCYSHILACHAGKLHSCLLPDLESNSSILACDSALPTTECQGRM